MIFNGSFDKGFLKNKIPGTYNENKIPELETKIAQTQIHKKFV